MRINGLFSAVATDFMTPQNYQLANTHQGRLKIRPGEIFCVRFQKINYLWAFFWNSEKKMSKSFSGQGSSKVQCQLCCSMFLMFIAIDHFSPCTMHLHIALRCIWIPLSFFLCALCSSKKCFMHDNETVPTSKKKMHPQHLPKFA